MNRDQVAKLLARITADWKIGSGQKPETLTVARSALAGSLAMGKSASEVHSTLPIPTPPPDLQDEVSQIVADLPEFSEPAELGFVRSAVAGDIHNPSGIPAWARGMQIRQTHGPFHDGNGLSQWVSIIPITISSKFAFGNPANVFGVFPVSLLVKEPPGELALGAGSVWFAAKLLVDTIPDGNFTGFRIQSGLLKSSAGFQLQGDVYVVPANATLTLTITLQAPAAPPGSGKIGADATSSIVQLPKTVTITFTQSAATIENLDTSSAEVYGSKFTLIWNKQAPVALDNNVAVLVPCDASAPTFTFSKVQSKLFTPSGSAPLQRAGWALPVAATTITALGEAAGAGSLFFALGQGADVKWELHPAPAPALSWQIEVAPGSLFVSVTGNAAPATTTFQLWPERPPSHRHSSLVFTGRKNFIVSFLAGPGTELVITFGDAAAHLDRPLAADGTRFPLQAPAVLSLLLDSAGTHVGLIGVQPQPDTSIVPIALENALIGVRPPAIFTVVGMVNGTSFTQSDVILFFNGRWLLPTLPDPYAASFGLDFINNQGDSGIGSVTALIQWQESQPVDLSFNLSAPSSSTAAVSPQSETTSIESAAPSPAALITPLAADVPTTGPAAVNYGRVALLDLSTRVDQFGVAIFLNRSAEDVAVRGNGTAPAAPAPNVGLTGMSLAVNGALAATFALPQVSWEPMESVAVPNGPPFTGPIACSPPSDGVPLLLQAPDEQQLVPFAPLPVLLNNIDNVIAGKNFTAEFSLPFGLNAFIRQPNRPPNPNGPPGMLSLFLSEGGEFQLNRPKFPANLDGAVQLTLKPPFPDDPRAMFTGNTRVDTTGVAPGYGHNVLDGDPLSDVAAIFEGEFDIGGSNPGVPVRRIDLAGYGASIFSEWADIITPPPTISKVQFETVVGRTAFELIEAVTVLYPYGPRLVRTVTIERQNSGWVRRTDSGWQPASQGIFVFPDAADYTNRIHRGAVAGVFNIRNIRELDLVWTVPPTPPGTPPPPTAFQFRQVLFDADIGIDHRVQVLNGGQQSTLVDADNQPVTLVPARDLTGYVQFAPDGTSPKPDDLAGLFAQTGPLLSPFSCIAEIGALGGTPGTILRCSAIEVNMATTSSGANPAPALACALRSAPVLPNQGAWSFGQRRRNAPAPAALASDFPVPLVQPISDPNNWHFADIADVLQLDNPNNFYGLLQNTGTQKLLFDQPSVPILSAASPPGSVPGIQLPNPPNFADVASLLNATGLFPDISSTISLLTAGIEQLNTLQDGLKYSKTYPFDPQKQPLSLLDLGVIKVALSYADESKGRDGSGNANDPTVLQFDLDPTAAKRWAFSIKPLTFLVTVPEFSSNPMLMIVGGFVADDQTKPTLAGLNIVYGDALSSLTNVLKRLEALASFLPGGSGAGLDVSLSDGKLTIRDTFALPTLPLGLGDITDISLDLGCTVQLSPLSADFTVGIGAPNNPFNWIVSPLAGNGLIDVGVQGNQPSLTVQGGIGLGLAIDVAIASGSASITIAVQLNVTGSQITLMALLTGQASVDVLDGLASASLTLTAAVGFALNPFPPHTQITLLPSPQIEFFPEDITLLASVSVGIHISICWVVSVDWDGSWQFSQTVTTPDLKVDL